MKVASYFLRVLVQVQEAGQFGTMDKLGMLLVTEDSIHTDCENYENMVVCKLLMTSIVQGISHTSCGHVPHSIHFGGLIEVFDLQRNACLFVSILPMSDLACFTAISNQYTTRTSYY
jgi:hypothetical protein